MQSFFQHHTPTFILALTLLFCGSSTQANSPTSEQTNLNLILRQLDTIDRITRSSESLPAKDGSRYTFDYPRLSAEIELIRQGIKAYQSPARAQPRHPPELTGNYLREPTDKP
ncbi:RAQPRD family integrative conjugative element protein [Pseudomonas quasicaspiana]|nr:RAQPRD family integrative conjugative element protein [Pseudomonas quasicaspiana]